MARVIVGKNGRIVIPKEIRELLEIKEGSVLDAFVAKEKTLLLNKIA